MSFTPLQITFFCFVILCFGSFSALFTVRWPRLTLYLWQKEAHDILEIPLNNPEPKDIASGRSHCESCQHVLRWVDLIPILSYLMLRGRCRYCNETISSRYALIEGAFLLTCAPLLLTCHSLSELIFNSIIICSLLTAAIIDFEHNLIPDECCAIAIACAFLLQIHSINLPNAVLGMLVGYGFIYGLRWIYLKIRQIEGIGLGDAKLFATLGAWLGAFNLATLLLYASVIGIMYFLLFKRRYNHPIPFGPFLVLSGVLHYFYLSL